MDDNVLLIFFSLMFLFSAACVLRDMNEGFEYEEEVPLDTQLQSLLGGLRENPSCGFNDVPNLMQAQQMVWDGSYNNGWIYDMYGWTAGNRGRIKNIN
jgi:hypothetical protein